MVMLTPKQREAVYPLANLMVLSSKLSEDPRFFNMSLFALRSNKPYNSNYRYPVLLDFFKRQLEHHLKEFIDSEYDALLKEFLFYSVSMFTMKIICIEMNPILAKFLKLAYRLNDEQFKEFISLVIQQFSKREYERKLEEGYTKTVYDGFGFAISKTAFFPNSEGKDVYDTKEVIRTYAIYEDEPILKDQHSFLKEDFAKGVDVYLNDEVVGKVYNVYMRLDKAMAKISHLADYRDLKNPRLIGNYILIPHLEFKVVRELQDPQGMTIKYVRPTIHKFTMYDKSKI
uniref:Uncharacterized protein n=1 Tax=Myoviridae sp. ctijX18 TaxID=2825154 RepID=A0A8S5USY9_9CAUD|nr:MAG TPA: hypothetical protein [Myoviridae sp. ctijX18]DAQ61254.1 MAG TPA: hypothetical protein [Caudoviricetes sp.]